MNRHYRYNFGFKYQKKCEGLCGGKTFTTNNGNQKYCEKCQEKLNIPKWDKQNKVLIRGDK